MSTSTLGGHVNTIPANKAGQRRRRRIHSDEFKARVVASCMQPGMSMAAVTMAHGVNANLLRRWVRDAEMKALDCSISKTAVLAIQAPERQTVFVPVSLPAPTEPTHRTGIRVELQRGTTTVTVTWLVSAAGECAAWMRELLR